MESKEERKPPYSILLLGVCAAPLTYSCLSPELHRRVKPHSGNTTQTYSSFSTAIEMLHLLVTYIKTHESIVSLLELYLRRELSNRKDACGSYLADKSLSR